MTADDLVPPRARSRTAATSVMSPSTSSPNFDRLAMTGDQVVEDDDAIAGPLQRLGRVAADVAGATGDEDGARASVQWRNR